MVIVRQKDRSEGFCYEYRKLNADTIKEDRRYSNRLFVFNIGFGEWLLANGGGSRDKEGVSIRP